MRKISLNILVGYTALLVIAVATSVIGVYIVRKVQREQPPQVVIVKPEEKPSQYPDYDAIKGENPDPKIKAVRVTDVCPSEGCINDKPATIDFDGITKQYRVSGKLSRAYLYVEAMVDYKRPLTVWDDIYFKINGFGGHLISDNNLLPVPPSEITRSLYDFRSISYYPNIKDKERKMNRQDNISLFSLLQDGIVLDITTSISSDRPGRVMKEIAIYYECFEGSDCVITEQSP